MTDSKTYRLLADAMETKETHDQLEMQLMNEDGFAEKVLAMAREHVQGQVPPEQVDALANSLVMRIGVRAVATNSMSSLINACRKNTPGPSIVAALPMMIVDGIKTRALEITYKSTDHQMKEFLEVVSGKKP